VLGGWNSGVLADAKSDFETLFGDEIKRVVASRKPAEAAALAGQMMLAAKSIKDRPDLHVMLWTSAADFGAKDPSGFAAATQALKNLLQAAPDDSSKWVEKLSGIYRRRYMAARGAERAKVGAEQVDEFITIGDAQTTAGRGRDAMATYRRALSTATAIRSLRRKEILEKIKAANAVATVQRDIERLKMALAKDPDDIKTRAALVMLYLVKLDDPAQAGRLLTDDLDEKLRTYVLLAAKNIEDLEAGPCFELGRWYWEMYPSARSSRAKLIVLRRTRAYLDRFKSLHTGKDLSVLRAAVILKKVDAESAKLVSKGAGGVLTKPAIIADFESRLVGWKVTGKAFGKGPCTGKPTPRWPASGFAGKLMISSYHEGDGSTGTLTSPKFLIRGKTITFLVVGGGAPGQTCMNLIVDKKVVRTVVGNGSNTLGISGWDVSDLVGKIAQLHMIDAHTGSWGHILVDHIVQHPGRIEEVLKRPKKSPSSKKSSSKKSSSLKRRR
jgi:hypothetical protein